jgi:hypothetical protein
MHLLAFLNVGLELFARKFALVSPPIAAAIAGRYSFAVAKGTLVTAA